jgi:dTMP kinase
MHKEWSGGAVCSLEGISGVGKSYLVQALRPALADLPVTFLTEVVDRTGQELDREIITLLAKRGDRFFRSGKPLTETFLLLALKMCDYEASIAPALAQGRMVLEDRSLHTIAVYQALILHPDSLSRQLEVAHDLYAIGARFRRAPQLTFLIEDDLSIVLPRIEQREGRALTTEEIAVLQRASLLYTRFAESQMGSMIRLQRPLLSLDAMVQIIREHLLALGRSPQRPGELSFSVNEPDQL